MKRFFILILLITQFNNLSFGQTADVSKGCSPLEVNFEASGLSDYYWVFIDGNATSELQNPQHNFTHPGVFQVTLYQGQGGNTIGSIFITVFEDPTINFTADQKEGCAPLNVNFTSEITLDSEISILSHKWAFGDGGVSRMENPSHSYDVAGDFKVSLELFTNFPSCNQSFSIDDFISTNSVAVDFSTDSYSACEAPHSFTFTNDTEFNSSYTYEWDFDNGQSSNSFTPPTITFNNEGIYTIKLTVTTPEGCIAIKEKQVSIGKPVFDFDLDSVVCIGERIFIRNRSSESQFLWNFGSGAFPRSSRARSPSVTFSEAGDNTISLRITGEGNCSADTTFTIFVEEVDPSFTLDPTISCFDMTEINLNALEKGYETYIWDTKATEDIIDSIADSRFTFVDPTRDSIYLHTKDTFFVKLTVVSEHGCIDTLEQIFIEQRPNAHVAPDIAQGCAPLTVTFSDSSYCFDPIIKWTYLYGDGQTGEYTNDNNQTHIYDLPGEYYVKVIIETAMGCLDTSAGLWINVGERITPDFTFDKTEICLEDSITVTFNNNDARIDGFHLDTDDGRFNHCWKDQSATHVFNTLPGTYPITATIDYNGCMETTTAPYQIIVNGAKADIGYMINCETSHDIMLESESTNASRLTWTVDTTIFIDEDSFVFNFVERGKYQIKLEAIDLASGCPATYDSVEIYITDIEAKFDLEEKVCDNEQYILRGHASIDVHESCNQGYLWLLPTRRPTESSWDSIPSFFPRGENFVTLIVEDINGCRDTLTQETTSYGIEPNFELDRTTFCVPAELHTTNNTTSDTTIVKWEWDNMDTQRETTYSFPANESRDSFIFTLLIEDALGCVDQYAIRLNSYRPESNMFLDPGTAFCVGEELSFSASDYTEQGSFLNFDWNLEGYGSFTDRENSITLDKSGKYRLRLNYQEDTSGCSGTIDTTIYIVEHPVASFISDVDSLDFICHPRIISFQSTSVFDSTGILEWMIPNTPLSDISNPFQSGDFTKGIHTVQLIASSIFGCADTISHTYELVGPEAEVIIDDSSICIGEEIRFEMINTVDVNSFEWDFGDGETSTENPISHKYEKAVDLTIATLTVKSQETGCDLSIDIPFEVNQVIADFERIDTAILCEGYAYIRNNSTNADQYEWTNEKGQKTSEGNPFLIIYPSVGTYTIELTASNSITGCRDEISKTIELGKVDDYYIVPNLFTPNGDGENDFFHHVVTNPNFEEFIEIGELRVYNRYGNLIYNNEEGINGWDGKYKGSDAPAGVYGYYILLDIQGCPSVMNQGNITLFR